MKKYTTGCRILDKAGVKPGGPQQTQLNICFDCERSNCVLDRNEAWDAGEEDEIILGMVIEVQCSCCGTLETVTMTKGKLRSGRFFEMWGTIYHRHHSGCGICGECRRFS